MAVVDAIPILEPLIEQGIIPPETRRVIIDIGIDAIAVVYYECFADEKMLEVLPDIVETAGDPAIHITDTGDE